MGGLTIEQQLQLARARAAQDTHEAPQRPDIAAAFTAGNLQGASIGAADEVGAAFRAVRDEITGDPSRGIEIPSRYRNYVSEIRAENERLQEAEPEVYGKAKFVGGMAGAAVPVGASLTAARGASLPVKMLAGAGAGAGTEAARGFLEGQDGALNRAMNIDPASTMTAGGVGAAVPLAGRAVGALLGRIPGRANPALRGMGMTGAASRQLSDIARRDQRGEIELYLRGLGDEGMLYDAGVNARQTARGIAGMPGEAGQIVADAAARRQRGRVGRISDDLDDVLGERQDMVARRDQLRAERSKMANEAYEAFRAKSFEMTPGLRDALAKADEQGGLADLRRMAQMRGWDVDAYMRGDTVAVSGEFLDEASKKIRDASGAAYKAGKGSLGKDFADLNNRLLDAAPELRSIRRQYYDDSQLIEVAEQGRAIFDKKMTPKEFDKWFNDLPPDAQEEFRLAARDEFANRVGEAVNDSTQSLNLLGPTNTLARVRTAFGPDAMRRLELRGIREREFAKSDNRIAGGSDTAATREFQNAMEPLRTDAGYRAGPVARVRQSVGDLGNVAVDSVIGANSEKIKREIAEALTAQGPRRDALIKALLSDAVANQKLARRSRGTETLINALLSPAAGSQQ